MNVEFLEIFSKNFQVSNFLKIRPMRTDLLHADGQTDGHDEAKSCFSQLCERE